MDYEITEEDAMTDCWWNYRLIRKGGSVGIHECYYDANGRIWACSVEPETATIEEDGIDPAIDSLRNMLQWMLFALDKPILDYDGIPEEGSRSPGNV